MKKFIFMLVCIAFYSLYAVQLIEIDKIEHDFGDINENGGIVSHSFQFTNVGTEVIEIKQIQTS